MFDRSSRVSGGRRRRAPGGGGSRQYPRSARVNEVLREVLAESLERMTDLDERLGLLTITAVSCDPDLRHATVWLASLSEEEVEALGELRIRLQAEISRQVRLKRTPQLSFQADPAIASGGRVEAILRDLELPSDSGPDTPGGHDPDPPVDPSP
ncbi:MAG: ribosome-binding factor A [Actinomycetota bacterium]|nr:ribosome-binding factor A [Actinomycetota bacterium]